MSVLKARAWRESATIMLIAKGNQGNETNKVDISKLSDAMVGQTHSYIQSRKFDYRVLLLKRSGKSSFMPNGLVFPGGAIDKADVSSEWWDVFEKVGLSRDRLRKVFEVKSARPLWTKNLPMLNGKNGQIQATDGIPLDVAFRLCAIRETFEESGVFLARTKAGIGNAETIASVFQPSSSGNLCDVTAWKKKVRKDANRFLELCKNYDVCPDVFALHEWSDWLTPIYFPQRFDTMFYISCVEKIPDVSVDMKEISDMEWCTPTEALTAHMQRKIWLPPPQVIELMRLVHIGSFQKLANFSFERRLKGVDTWIPVRMHASDGDLHVMPGDELYPADPDYLGEKKAELSSAKTLSELNKCATNKNRVMFENFHITNIFCNVTLPHGQLNPCVGVSNNK